MAFHVACPITCRKICFCPLGFPRDLSKSGAEEGFLNDVARIEELLKDPSSIRALKAATVQVLVPKVVPPPPPPPPITLRLPPPPPPKLVAVANFGDGSCGGGDWVEEESAAAVSAQNKRVALQKKAAAAMVAAEDYARQYEAGDVAVALKDATGDEQSLSNSNVFCRMCFLGEKEGSERARKMLSCKICGKKYHRSCLKSWAQHRDLFHWSSWTCPSCRTCKICRKVGDPSKFMFCKRCDGAFHCYCQHPPHKNVSSGPYLCPNHTRCHSCGSNVPGNGLSVRWFLGYTCCDACGRLFVKGNYCPVCLKVYRDSESTPMVCCDICQRWVHCHCDGISDEKYLRFQVDGNLQYNCATCRGECYQVKDHEDAVQELWRRRDKADRDLIASLRAAAGLPTREDIFSISPYSDDEENGPVRLKNEFGRSLKLSLKGFAEKSPKKNTENGKKSWKKKSSKKKGYQASLVDKMEPECHVNEQNGQGFDYTENDNVKPHGKGGLMTYSSRVAGIVNHSDTICSISQPGVLKHKLVDEVMESDRERKSRIVKIKSKNPHVLESGDDTENQSKSKSLKTKKLVINLGPRKINVTNSPRSDTSSCQREQDFITSNGSDDIGNRLILNAHDGNARYGDGDMGNNLGHDGGLKFIRREENLINYGRTKSESSNLNPKLEQGTLDNRHEVIPPDKKHSSSGKKSSDEDRVAVGHVGETPSLISGKISLSKQSEGKPATVADRHGDSVETPVMQSLSKPSKFSLKLKIKKPDLENQNSQIPMLQEEKSSVRGQRSKRKRSSTFVDKIPFKDDKDVQSHHDSEMMEASWILKKLGKDAIGKTVEVHQLSDDSWHKGVVSDVTEGTSMFSISLDDGREKSLELGKQRVCFIPRNQKRSGM